jgi:23S rRNA (adenine2503-C2)-methyltransferase
MEIAKTPRSIYDLNLNELETAIQSWEQPAYRAKQVWQGIYQHLWSQPEQFTTLPKPLRDRLFQEFSFVNLHPEITLQSRDQETTKVLLRMPDRQAIETVLMRYSERRTLCISTQAGCAMGCVFCATGQMGFKRHLTSGEIVEQVLFFARQLKEQGERVTNVVVMGMGEPFHNYNNTLAAVDRLNDPEGFNLGARHFTISTVGIVPMIQRFAKEKRQVNLAISLHAANDVARSALLPVNRKYPMEMLLDACREYVDQTHRRITFEWALIRDVNDTPQVAAELAHRLKGLLCHVNVIPLNPTQKYPGHATTRERAEAFKTVLEEKGIPCTIRIRRGIDIQAGCGQLADPLAGARPIHQTKQV